MKKVFLLVGVPSSGKSWIAKQLKDRFQYVSHDDHIDKDYYDAIVKHFKNSDPKPILIETPFGMTELSESLKSKGIKVIPVFIREHPTILAQRYAERDGKSIPKGHLTRQVTYGERAKELGAFIGTSQEVLKHLKDQT